MVTQDPARQPHNPRLGPRGEIIWGLAHKGASNPLGFDAIALGIVRVTSDPACAQTNTAPAGLLRIDHSMSTRLTTVDSLQPNGRGVQL